MKKLTTPDWLLDAQNRSWEPEILISGITLTSLFILTDKIYNLFAMLIQEFGLWTSIGFVSFILTIVMLTGFKIIIISHLILRGIWTGLVGLSYVFPDGVKKENLPEKYRDVEFRRPEILVIQVEKICSLLFAFIFTSFVYVFGFFIIYIPIILLFVSGIDLYIVRIVIVYIILPLAYFAGFFIIFLDKRKRDSNYRKKARTIFLNNLLEIFSSNVGRKRMGIVFTIYFLIITLLSLPTIYSFDFNNKNGVEIPYKYDVKQLNNNNYENIRNGDLRIPKATIGSFHSTKASLELFIAYFREDTYTVKMLEEISSSTDAKNIKKKFNMTDLYDLYIDNEKLTGLSWYKTEHQITGQTGMIVSIPVDNLKIGYHELIISKMVWSFGKKRIKHLNEWEIIPFEKTDNSD